MKKIILLILLVTFNSPVYSNGHNGNNWWIAPAIISGAVVGYALARPVQPPTYPQYYQQPIPMQYHYQNIFDPYCNCYRTVLVPNY